MPARHHRWTGRLAALGLMLAADTNTVAGQPGGLPPGLQVPTLRTSVTTIEVDAVVTRDGKPVRDLAAEDFEIIQDGRRQRITTFTYVAVDGTAPAPAADATPVTASNPDLRGGPSGTPATGPPAQEGRHLVFVVDDLSLAPESILRTKAALSRVIDTQLGAADRVAIVRTGGEAGLYQQFTGDRTILRSLVGRLRYNMSGRGLPDRTIAPADALVPAPATDDTGGTAATAFGTERSTATIRERDARRGAVLDLAFASGVIGTLNAVVASLREIPGRKGIVLLTNGFALDQAGLLRGLRPVIDLATRTRTVMYTVNVARFNPTASVNAECCPVVPSRYSPDAGSAVITLTRNTIDALRDLKQGPDFLAHETGGFFFANPSDLELVITRSLDDQRGYYLLGYSPDDRTYQDEPKRFHKIVVKVRKPGHSVRARSGFLGNPELRTRPVPRSAITTAALSAFSRNDLDLRLTAFFMAPDGKAPLVRVLVHLDRERLQFATEGLDMPTAQIELEAYAVDAQGIIVGQDRQGLRVRQTAADPLDGGDKVGFLYRLDVPVEKPGAYSLRLAVRDRGADTLGSASQFVIVPDLKKGIALSGLLVGASEAGAAGDAGEGSGATSTVHPALRRFTVPSRLTYTLQIYNARYQAGRPALRASAEIRREDRLVYAGPSLDVQTSAMEGEPITVAGVLALARGFAPGDYALRVTVVDALAKGAAPVSTVVDFTVEDGARRVPIADDRRK